MNNDLSMRKMEYDEIDTNHLKIKLEPILIALVFAADVDGNVDT